MAGLTTLRVLAEMIFPPVIRLSGQRPSQLAKSPAVGKAERSDPHSANSVWYGVNFDAGDGREIHAEDAVELGPKIEAEWILSILSRAGTGWQRLLVGIGLGFEADEHLV